MKQIQGNLICKAVAILLLVCSAFGGSMLGLQAISAAPYAFSESWTDTSHFHYLLDGWKEDTLAYLSNQLSSQNRELSYMSAQQLERRIAEFETQFDPSATLFRYQIRSADGSTTLYSNLEEGQTLSDVVESVEYTSLYRDGSSLYSDYGNLIYEGELHSADATINAAPDNSIELEAVPFYIIEYGVTNPDSTHPLSDEFSSLIALYDVEKAAFSTLTGTALLLLTLCLVCLIYLLWTAGHKTGVDGIVLSWQDRIFFDLYLCAMVLIGVGLFAILLEFGYYLFGSYAWFYAFEQEEMKIQMALYRAIASGCLSAIVVVIVLTMRTFAVRLKAHALIQTTLICRVFRFVFQTVRAFVSSLPVTWNIVAGFLLYVVACFMLRMAFDDYSFLPILVINSAVLFALCWWAMCFQRLRKGSQSIAAGNLNHQIDTARMPSGLKAHAHELNNISVGLSSAVDEKMKSERFKAELITNVSHDLKTPLTSIINYVNLLKTTEQTDPKAQEYIEVLDRKSMRLKKLTEDLVEASKASTGVLSVNREKIGMIQLMDQALGEWREKLESRTLSVVTTLPEGETWVYADGRHLWRVIDNLLSNCAKYAMEGTRVYLELNRGHGQVTLSVKNISRDALNLPPEQLMERFVRGEESRSTEGSGLGLSIARSLVELQGGTLALLVDGDLFKVVVTLPQAS